MVCDKKKCCQRLFFNQFKSFHLFVVVFLCIFASCESYIDSQATNRSAAEEGGSYREPSLLLISRLGVIYDSQLHGYAFFL
jgi:hypothetical protein